MKVKLSHTRPTMIAYIEHRGSYSTIPWDADLERLYGFAKSHKLRPAMHPMGIYLDNPANVPEASLRAEVAVPIQGEAASEGDVLVKALPAMDVAVAKFKGSTSDLQAAYAEMGKWIDTHGYAMAGASMEVYTSKPKVRGGKTQLTAKIEIPVRRR